MKITDDFEKIHKIKELAKRNIFDITPEDSDYIVENITDIFHAVYFVFDEWEKMKSALMILGGIPTEKGGAE